MHAMGEEIVLGRHGWRLGWFDIIFNLDNIKECSN